MNDYILRATAGNSVRAFVAVTTETVNEAFNIHQTSPVVTAALGRLLTAAAMMGATLKNENGILTLSIKSDGPLNGLIATSDSLSRVKGFAYNNNVELPLKANGKLDVSGAIGKGKLSVIMDTGMKEPYTGQIELVSGEIAEDLAAYFAESEQTPAAVALGVLVDTDWSVRQAGGYILQAMPGADDSVLARLEANAAALPAYTTLLERGLTAEDILSELTQGIGYEVSDIIPATYYCNCDRARVEKALISVGREELTKILNEDKQAELHCHFCNKKYLFNEDELRRLLEEAKE
jgi:molecular chaperone Hsp33